MHAAIELSGARRFRARESRLVTERRPANARFPKSARLLKRSQFRAVYDRGARARGRLLVVFAARGSGECARLGITATRKIGGAVQRNAVRRRIREAFRHLRHEIPPLDYVVNVRRAAVERGTAENVREELRRLVIRAGREVEKRVDEREEVR